MHAKHVVSEGAEKTYSMNENETDIDLVLVGIKNRNYLKDVEEIPRIVQQQ